MEQAKSIKKRRDNKVLGLYSRCLLTRKIELPISCIGKNIDETIEQSIKDNFEGKCQVEGYIKPNSSKIIQYSSGVIERGNIIIFEVIFECDACFPVEGMLINCVAKNITSAGIRAESATEIPSPIIVFIIKDHHYDNKQFAEIKVDDKFNARIIGTRFELNQGYVGVIGELVKEKEYFAKKKPGTPTNKPKLIIQDEE